MHCLLRGKFGRRLGNAHHAAQLQPWQFCHGLGQLQSLFGGHTGFVVAAIHIDLDANVQRRQVRGPLVGQALGDFETIHRVHPVEVLGHQARLVALNGANAVPLPAQYGTISRSARILSTASWM